MKKRDEGKASLVDFLRSIKFAHDHTGVAAELECPTHFANFKQSARSGNEGSQEDSELIRSAN
ncbi:MAG: hypothetical protein V7746_14425 [Halioglobus sp.]